MPHSQTPRTLLLWQRVQSLPLGKRLFSLGVCRKAPYFGSVHPRLLTLEPGHAVVWIRNRRAMRNHLGGVHAIAMCNAAEFAMGLLLEASTPPSHRWIPKGMQVTYLAAARTDLLATATGTVDTAPDGGRESAIAVALTDRQGTVVCQATITVWVTPRPARTR